MIFHKKSRTPNLNYQTKSYHNEKIVQNKKTEDSWAKPMQEKHSGFSLLKPYYNEKMFQTKKTKDSWEKPMQEKHLGSSLLKPYYNDKIFRTKKMEDSWAKPIQEKHSGVSLFNRDWFSDNEDKKIARKSRVFDSPFFQESSFHFEPFEIPDQFRGFHQSSNWFGSRE